MSAVRSSRGTPRASLLPEVVDLDLYAGDGALLRIEAFAPEFVFEGVPVGRAPVPLLGRIAAQIRERRTDADALLDWTVDTSEANDGAIQISLSARQTASLVDPDVSPTVQVVQMLQGGRSLRFDGAWDVEWTLDDSEPMTLVQGDVVCMLDVTRA